MTIGQYNRSTTVQYFKSVFLIILNVLLRTAFTELVTFMFIFIY